jgi:hypothetical protein
MIKGFSRFSRPSLRGSFIRVPVCGILPSKAELRLSLQRYWICEGKARNLAFFIFTDFHQIILSQMEGAITYECY